MHVLDLEKQGEVNTLMTLVLINLLILLANLISPDGWLNILTYSLTVLVTAVIVVLLGNGKKTLTICKHGVHTLSIFKRANYFSAKQINHIRPYSICGIKGVIITGEKFICVAPFYTLTNKHQQRLKRYENGLYEWLITLQNRNDYC